MIDRRLRLLAKLAYPKINTLRTVFVLTALPTGIVPIPQKLGTPLTPNGQAEELRPRRWHGTGKKTRRYFEIVCAYSSPFDICAIYSPQG